MHVLSISPSVCAMGAVLFQGGGLLIALKFREIWTILTVIARRDGHIVVSRKKQFLGVIKNGWTPACLGGNNRSCGRHRHFLEWQRRS